MARPKSKVTKTCTITYRVTDSEAKELDDAMASDRAPGGIEWTINTFARMAALEYVRASRPATARKRGGS